MTKIVIRSKLGGWWVLVEIQTEPKTAAKQLRALDVPARVTKRGEVYVDADS